MSMTSELSASDVALLSGRNSNQNGDGFFGGNGAYWIIILFLFVFCGWGNNGWGASFQAKRLKRSNFNEYREQSPKQSK